VKDFEAAKASLWSLYNISLENLTTKIVESGFDIEQGRKILGEQTLVANTVYERRVREFFEKFQPFKQTEYGLDLSPVQALSFEGVDYPYGLAKDTLEKSAQRYYQELMNQKVDEGIVKAVIEEQRNYGYIYINLRIDEYACYRRMQELLGSSMS
jgi:hypothetical protein